MSVSCVRRLAAWSRAAAAALCFCGTAGAAQTAVAPAAEDGVPVANSAIDAALFYQVLIGEIEASAGNAGNAYEIVLDAARRTRSDQLFRRATEIALRARAGEQALAATKAWRSARPESTEAVRLQLQILIAMGRTADLVEPLRALLQATAPAERAALIASLPRALQRGTDKRQVAAVLDEVLLPYANDATTRVAVQVATARAWAAAGETERALKLVRQAQAEDPAAPGPALLALELMGPRPEAEAVVLAYLKGPGAENAVRRAYASQLINMQRYGDAVAQLEIVTARQPDFAAPWLTLGALQLELRQPQAADATVQHYVRLVQAQGAAAAPAAPGGDDDEDEDDSPTAAGPDAGLTQAWLLLAQAAEMRGDFAAAEGWLARVDNPQRALEVQARRASLLARQGRLEQGRALIQRAPERDAADARAKVVAEAQLLREARQWQTAYDLLADGSRRFPGDVDLLYEQAMMAEKLGQADAMERLLREVIALKPEHAHAHNALGYSLADRNQRLPEARLLIQRALELAPGDPFITDSLGWVEYRLGNHAEALRLLRLAYQARPDTEIGAHLGEVLWVSGQHDEARRIWAEARSRDAGNEVLRETLQRLGAAP
jgi:tetratricopeptide (TPR) repeat protein